MKRSDLTSAFTTFDRDSKGFVNVSDLITVRDQLGDEMSHEEVQLMFEWADKDQDDQLKQQEFIKALCGCDIEDEIEEVDADREVPDHDVPKQTIGALREGSSLELEQL